MSSKYVVAADRLGWLLDAIEASLQSRGASETKPLTPATMRSACPGRLATLDEAMAAIRVLHDLGVLSKVAGGYSLNADGLHATAAYRRGVRDGLRQSSRSAADRLQLCAALPVGLPSALERELREATVDLRGAIVDMIAAARFHLVLASPFWDAPTLEEISLAIRTRLTEGVRVRFLGRFEHTLDAVTRTALAALVSHGNCSVLDWYEPSATDPLGSRTFHFKAVIVDEGARAYLGTANLTKSGLRSRLELGVLLQGADASHLASVVDLVLQLARPITEP